MQQKVHGADSGELHPIDHLAFVVVCQQLDEGLLCEEGAQPGPCGVGDGEKADVAIGAFVACSGVEDAAEGDFGGWAEG